MRRIRTEPPRLLASRSELGYVDRLDKALRSEREPEPEAVPAEYQDVLVMDARMRQASRVDADRAQEQARAQIRSLTEMLRELSQRQDINRLLLELVQRVKSEYRQTA